MFALKKTSAHLAVLALALSFSTASTSQPMSPPPVMQPATPPVASAAQPLAAGVPVVLPSSPVSAATAMEIQKLNESMTLLQAQLNHLELKAKIAAKQREITVQPGTSALVASSFASKSGNPSVVSVAGLKGSLEAVLVFPGGVTQRVKTGDVIDDRQVSKIEVNEVSLTDLQGKNVQRLAFGSTATTRESASPSAGMMPPSYPPSMPGPMPR